MISFSNTAGIVTHHTHALETKPKPKPIAEKEVYEFVDGGMAEIAKSHGIRCGWRQTPWETGHLLTSVSHPSSFQTFRKPLTLYAAGASNEMPLVQQPGTQIK